MTVLNHKDLNPATGPELTHLDPIPSYEESIAAPRPNSLQILGATFGGVVVTPQIQALVGSADKLTIDLPSIHTLLGPDPGPCKVKVLTVLYRFDDDDDLAVRLLCAPEDSRPPRVTISRQATAQQQQGQQMAGGKDQLHGMLERPWRAGPQGGVEILAVVYGPKRIETPTVQSVLANHFEGRWGQVRMTNSFFETDTWPKREKTWTVYFRFVGSKRVQVVTGWEHGALEVPWSRQ